MRISEVRDVETWEAKQPTVTSVSSLQPNSLQWKAVSSRGYQRLKYLSNENFQGLSHVLCTLPFVSGSARANPCLKPQQWVNI